MQPSMSIKYEPSAQVTRLQMENTEQVAKRDAKDREEAALSLARSLAREQTLAEMEGMVPVLLCSSLLLSSLELSDTTIYEP